MALEALTWEQTCEAIATLYGTDAQTIANTLTANGVAVGDVEQAFKMLEGTPYEIWYNADGTVRSYNYIGMPETYLANGNASDVTQIIDSNAQVSTKTAVKIPLNTAPSVSDPTKVTFGAGMKQAGNFVLKEILPAIAAANVGITLGKTIDSVLYNANPDFWDSQGWGSINPETWASITQDDDSLGAKVFNTVFKIDPQTNTSQAYLDQDAFAYLALMLQKAGFFATGTTYVDGEINNISIVQPLYEYEEVTLTYNNSRAKIVLYAPAGVKMTVVSVNNRYQVICACARDNTNKYVREVTYNSEGNISQDRNRSLDNQSASYGGTNHPFNCQSFQYSTDGCLQNLSTVQSQFTSISGLSNHYIATGYALLAGEEHSSQPIPGIGTQTGATTPSLDNNDTVAETLAKLMSQYPELFNNAISQDVVQPDGTVKTYTYIPVSQAQPTPNPTDGYDPQNQPISSTSTQTNPEVDPQTATQAQLEYLIGLITDLANPNMQNTGEGSTPPVVIPTGSASALYTVYNPTESEINSFGSWLWSANFVDQLLKMFNDPMQAIISLHKVFCTPSISGRNNIKVGYLDSGVSANVVNSQYVTIDCGTVNLSEEFKNVFDYSPFTDVSLYLPFIGFVKLDVNDVMRGSINVVYHIDVLTGACLAEVNVTRDMFGGVIYQYSGNCSVHYPLSSGSYMGIVSALLGVAGTFVSGGSLAPMAIGMATDAMRGHTNIGRSGNLSGNAGAMGIKKPFIVLQKPQTSLANDFETFVGKPANYTVKIGECSGFISCTEVHIENCNGTDSELAELENLLKKGILI